MIAARNGNLVGWCCYDGQLWSQGHLDAVRQWRPGIVRWFCSLDRYSDAVSRRTALSASVRANLNEAARILDAVGSSLVVQLQMKMPGWTANDAGNTTGLSWARQSPREGWFANPGVWMSFIDSIRSSLPPGTPTAWGAWNEPDWLLDWWWKSRVPGWTQRQWQNGWWTLPPQHAFGWTGGLDKLARYRALLPDLTWTSDGISVGGAYWPATYDGVGDGKRVGVSVLDVHSYQTSAVGHLDYIGRYLQGPQSESFFLGEFGSDASSGAVWDAQSRATTEDVAVTLAAAHSGFAGLCVHSGGPQLPHCWQVGPVPQIPR